MSQVSRIPISKKTEEKLFKIFFNSLTNLSDSADIQKFLFALLSPVEQTMLTKRLAIAILLTRGNSYEAIKEILHVSQETISRVNIALNHKGEGYHIVVKKIFRDEKLDFILKNR